MPNKVQTPTNPVNEAHKSYKQNRTTFPVSYAHYTSEVYGRLQPFFFMDGVEGDTIPLNSHQEVRTPTLKAPLMSKITKSKDYYAIPMRAILPKTWEMIYTNPTQGDDIPEDANCFIHLSKFIGGAANFFRMGSNVFDMTPYRIQLIIRNVLFYEMFFSDGSLLAKDGIHLSSLFEYRPATQSEDGTWSVDVRDGYNYDQWFDMKFVPWLQSLDIVFDINGHSYALDKEGTSATADNYVSMHRLLELLRDYADFEVTSVNGVSEDIAIATTSINDLMDPSVSFSVIEPADDQVINIAHLVAYQIVCYHFYTNDKIDSIYTAQLYRGLMTSLFGAAVNSNGDPTANYINSIRKYFSYNGELLEYDIFSSAVLDNLAGSLVLTGIPDALTSYTSTKKASRLTAAFRNIFGYNRSLRYGDYFTGSRPSPLAVGDINTTVVDSSVNALDMTKSLLMQRFLNSVNRVGRKFSSYVQMLSGRLPASTPTNPMFLAHTTDIIGSYEVENTSENQGKIVTNMRDGSSKYAFSYDVNEPCVVLGISWYEVARIYSRTIERRAFHKTRFDMFNKFFQYAGDQAIFRKELDARWLSTAAENDPNFGYTLRYMEYKQRISHCSGAFARYLPGYAFITDKNRLGESFYDEAQISPEYIRAHEEEFDQFFSSVSNYSLGGCLHFIVKYVNECDAERQMEYAPSML